MKRIGKRSLALALVLGLGCAHAPHAGGGATTGKAGSMARFVMHRDHLFALSQADLLVYETPPDAGPRLVSTTRVRSDAQTLFPHDDLLFIGTRRGMLVYSLAEPTRPAFLGEAHHVESCDPVVVQGDVAYVTLSSGAGCRQGENGLFVFDVSNPTAPREVARRAMARPRGLGVDGGLLFVADEQEGLVVYDVGRPHHPRRVASVPSISGYDVIAHGGILYIVADDGLYQYLYQSGGDELVLPLPLSRIPMKPRTSTGDPP